MVLSFIPLLIFLLPSNILSYSSRNQHAFLLSLTRVLQARLKTTAKLRHLRTLTLFTDKRSFANMSSHLDDDYVEGFWNPPTDDEETPASPLTQELISRWLDDRDDEGEEDDCNNEDDTFSYVWSPPVNDEGIPASPLYEELITSWLDDEDDQDGEGDTLSSAWNLPVNDQEMPASPATEELTARWLRGEDDQDGEYGEDNEGEEDDTSLVWNPAVNDQEMPASPAAEELTVRWLRGEDDQDGEDNTLSSDWNLPVNDQEMPASPATEELNSRWLDGDDDQDGEDGEDDEGEEDGTSLIWNSPFDDHLTPASPATEELNSRWLEGKDDEDNEVDEDDEGTKGNEDDKDDSLPSHRTEQQRILDEVRALVRKHHEDEETPRESLPTSTTPPTSPNLLTIPQEIRNQIIHSLLVDSHHSISLPTFDHVAFPDLNPHLSPSILSTCHLLNTEASTLLYAKNVFNLEAHTRPFASPSRGFTPIQPANMAKIAHLAVPIEELKLHKLPPSPNGICVALSEVVRFYPDPNPGMPHVQSITCILNTTPDSMRFIYEHLGVTAQYDEMRAQALKDAGGDPLALKPSTALTDLVLRVNDTLYKFNALLIAATVWRFCCYFKRMYRVWTHLGEGTEVQWGILLCRDNEALNAVLRFHKGREMEIWPVFELEVDVDAGVVREVGGPRRLLGL
jgi:hypothetical protein